METRYTSTKYRNTASVTEEERAILRLKLTRVILIISHVMRPRAKSGAAHKPQCLRLDTSVLHFTLLSKDCSRYSKQLSGTQAPGTVTVK